MSSLQYKIKRRKPIKLKIGIFISIIFIIILFIILYLNYIVNPVIIEYSIAKTRSLSQKAVEEAVYQTINQGFIYDDLINITHDENGDVMYISTNSLQINLLARDLAKNSQKQLETMGNTGIDIPLGTFTGMPIFVGRGPEINIKLLPIGSISCKFSSEFLDAGINQTNHKIYLTVTTNVSIILPTANETVQTTSQLMIAESIIVGKIPDTYLNSSSIDDMLNLVP